MRCLNECLWRGFVLKEDKKRDACPEGRVTIAQVKTEGRRRPHIGEGGSGLREQSRVLVMGTPVLVRVPV